MPKAPHPVVLADYGASTGHNSLLPIGAAIEVLSKRIRTDQAVLVTHTDVAENDFTVLFRTLADDPDTYLGRKAAAFATAIGRSFYPQILPSDSVTLAWSSWAIHWLSRLPRRSMITFCRHSALTPRYARRAPGKRPRTGTSSSHSADANSSRTADWWC